MYLFDGAPIKKMVRNVCLLVMFTMSNYIHFMLFELWRAKMGLGTEPQNNISMHAFAPTFTKDLIANDWRMFDWLGALNKKNDEKRVYVSYVDDVYLNPFYAIWTVTC